MNTKMIQPQSKTSYFKLNSSGQILLEYILLLMIGLVIGNILISKLTAFSDEPDNRGAIINRWIQIWDSIGKDFPDK